MNLRPLPPQGSAIPTAPHPDALFLALSHNFIRSVVTCFCITLTTLFVCVFPENIITHFDVSVNDVSKVFAEKLRIEILIHFEGKLLNLRPLPPQGRALPTAPHPDDVLLDEAHNE